MGHHFFVPRHVFITEYIRKIITGTLQKPVSLQLFYFRMRLSLNKKKSGDKEKC